MARNQLQIELLYPELRNALETGDSEELEAVTGLTRYELARQFRAVLGTSPYRYITQRRLNEARRLVLHGVPLSEAAVAWGFFDQSHMTRLHTQAFGISPARWLKMLR